MSQLTYRSDASILENVFGVFIRPQTYKNIFYLYLAFPLGIAYFVFLVTGLSLGFGLIITLAGIPILILVIIASWALAYFERQMAIMLLGEDIPPSSREDQSGLGMWQRLKALLTNPTTWTGILYLLAKFPIGIASFVITTVLIAISFGFISAPIYYDYGDVDFGIWRVDTLGKAFVLTAIGIPLLIITPHILNFAAFLSGRFAYLMLGLRWWE